MKLFCLSHAGGNAAFYDGLEQQLSDRIELIKFEYSGHGRRHKEKYYSSIEEMAEDAYKHLMISISPKEAYSIMGYSMGSIVAVEVLKKILGERSNMPRRVFLAAHEPQTKAELAGFDSDENDDLVKARTIKFGAVPEPLIENRCFWRMYLPIYKADYSIIGKYRFENLKLATDIPATVFYSNKDTPLNEMKKWSRYFAGECDLRAFAGNHFFIQNNLEEIADIIYTQLEHAE